MAQPLVNPSHVDPRRMKVRTNGYSRGKIAIILADSAVNGREQS